MRVEGLDFSTGNEPTEEELMQFFDNLAVLMKKYEKESTKLLDPKKVRYMMECAKQIEKELDGQDVVISVNPFKESSGLGTITIKSYDNIVFKHPELLSDMCRANRGLDIDALNTGETVVTIGFKTTQDFIKG